MRLRGLEPTRSYDVQPVGLTGPGARDRRTGADLASTGLTAEVRSVAEPDEVAAYRPVISEATLHFSTETRLLSERDTYGKAFLQVLNLWRQDDGVAAFVLADRFSGIAAR